MKRFVFLLICFSFIFGCTTGEIQVKKDSFKNSIVITMDMDHDATIDGGGFSKGVTTYGGKYFREIKDGKSTPTNVFFSIIASVNVNDLKNEAFIKVDNKVTELKLNDPSSKMQTEVEHESKTEKNFMTGKDEVKVESSTRESKLLTGKIMLTSDLEKAIINSKSLEYRLYAMTDAITMKVSDSELIKIKEFLNTKGEK
ncbi:MAG: hypothetical protein V1874_03650 [Spirochaetota bacterium]